MEDILKKLVGFPSVTGDRQSINAAIGWVDRFLSERGMRVMRFEFNGSESVVATTRETKKPKLFLAGHVDVAPASEDELAFREENGRYYGRGTADMKFALAAYLQLVDELGASLKDYDLGLMITSDEETGGFNGVKRLVELGYRADVVVYPDAGDTPDGWKFELFAKGRRAITLEAHGKAAHGSRPWAGENAIDKLIAAVDEIRGVFEDQGPDTNTFALAALKGGEAFNQIPAHASADLDVRTVSNEDGAALKRQMEKICARRGLKLRENTDAYSSAFRTDPNDPYVAKFLKIAQKVIPEGKLHRANSTGASDARFFGEVGVPCIIINPPCDGYHGANEWVSKEGIEQLLEILRLYVDEIAKS
jgi:acetylornithine deacetylase/succinyl-diaminopimelate desuccinylase-like protein